MEQGLRNCSGGTIKEEQRWWNSHDDGEIVVVESDSGTGMVGRQWWNSQRGTEMVKQRSWNSNGGTVMVEQGWWSSNGGTASAEQ